MSNHEFIICIRFGSNGIGGGISTQPLLLEMTQKHIDTLCDFYYENHYPVSKPIIKIAQYGNDANLLGAYLQLRKGDTL